MRVVRLHKDKKCGLGMVVTCGSTYDTILHGAFIESIYPGGPADLDGNINPGDQIMSVNGTNVQKEHFLTAVDLIQCSSSPVELIIAKSSKSFVDNTVSKKDIVEESFTKTKTWTVGDEKIDPPEIIENAVLSDVPIPKPRKRLSQKRSNEQLPLDVPDLTINHSVPSNKVENVDCQTIKESFNSENGNIPDIIASQMKNLSLLNNRQMLPESCDLPESESSNAGSLTENELLPGEVYHVVLDKRGGSLGLNIFQGSESNCSQKRHIYIHSIIPKGAAELDGRIKPGDKLLEVNGLSLEDLSYQEVVTKLRESPQVAHLVLEKGNGFLARSESDCFSNSNSLPRSKTKSENIYSSQNHMSSSLISHESDSLTIDKICEELISNEDLNSTFAEVFSNQLNNEDRNSYSSMPPLVDASLLSAKENDSPKNSYQHGSRKDSSRSLSPSPPYAKGIFQNTLTSYKSTPNLAESSDEDDRTGSCLYRNKSTDCLEVKDGFPEQYRIFDLYQNYSFIRGSSSSSQIPAVPIRKKKLKRLEDICNYCNSDNTFYVTICKSSRGLGLSIIGGRDSARKDFYSQLIRIRKLYPLQPALECGKLAVGDVILEVNGISMFGLTNTEALEVLRIVPTDVTLKVFRPSKSQIPSISAFQSGFWPSFDSTSSSASSSLSRTENNSYSVEAGEFEIILLKQDGSLGFTITRNEESNYGPSGIYVKALVRQHAVSDGRIQPGDRILQVNGQDVSSMSHAQAIALLRNTTERVVLKLYRDDPPLTPTNLEDCSVPKPLRWEALELLSDRMKQKNGNEESNTLKRKLKRKLDRSSNAPSNSSVDSSSSSSSGGQEHTINDTMVDKMSDMQLESVGLQRNQRPKSLDALNSSDRKRFVANPDEESFHRQASVMCPNTESKIKDEVSDKSESETKGNLIKWRGSTLPDSEVDVAPLKPVNIEKQVPEIKSDDEADDYKPVPFPRTTSSNIWVRAFDVDLDRGWHLRLGFSLCDPSNSENNHRHMLPNAPEVKTVYPGSLALKDGRIKSGDRLVEVNGESMLGKPAPNVVDILRKTRGVIKMVFCRLEQRS